MQYQQGNQPPSMTTTTPPRRRQLSRQGKRALFFAVLALALVGLLIVSISAAGRIQKARQEQEALSSALSPYADKFLPNISMDGIALGGMTAQQGLDAVIGQIQSRNNGPWSSPIRAIPSLPSTTPSWGCRPI